jgi:hypothetical protein
MMAKPPKYIAIRVLRYETDDLDWLNATLERSIYGTKSMGVSHTRIVEVTRHRYEYGKDEVTRIDDDDVATRIFRPVSQEDEGD